MNNVIGLVLGGGAGTRLRPLTEYRSKPAVPLGGKYRLIDVPISNCLNSGINRIYVLTQFNSVSLHRHIRQTYVFDPFHGGFVEILAAQQTRDPQESDWYQGTADAVRKQLRYVKQRDVDYVLILSGDQLYRMDFRDLLETHQRTGADATIAGLPVPREQAASYGIMRVSDSGRVEGFLEKPQSDAEIALVRTDPAWIDKQGIESKGRECLASMGIYLFNRDVLVELLENSTYRDFGKEVFPMAIRARRVQLHLFDGYWEDIGTIRSFYEANLALAGPEPPFQFVSENKPIYSRPRFLPPTRIRDATIRNSLVADGCYIADGAVVENSVIGLRCQIQRGAVIRNSILMGYDYYESPEERAEARAAGIPSLEVGQNAFIEKAIVDKNCRIGANVRIAPSEKMPQEGQVNGIHIRDGILVIPKGSVFPEGWSLEEKL